MILYKVNTCTKKQIKEHLDTCSSSFTPPLDTRVDIDHYSKKIYFQAKRFEAIEIYEHEDEAFFSGLPYLVGLIAVYENKDTDFITSVSVLPQYTGKNISSKLLSAYISASTCKRIRLEVDKENLRAISFYKKHKFKVVKEKKEQRETLIMEL